MNWVKIKPLLGKEYVVIFDRYYLDLVVDSERMRISLNKNFLFLVYKFFIPKPQITVYLEADSEIIKDRKKELSKYRIKELQFLYHRFISSEKKHLIINTSQLTVDQEKEAVKKCIVNYLSFI